MTTINSIRIGILFTFILIVFSSCFTAGKKLAKLPLFDPVLSENNKLPDLSLDIVDLSPCGLPNNLERIKIEDSNSGEILLELDTSSFKIIDYQEKWGSDSTLIETYFKISFPLNEIFTNYIYDDLTNGKLLITPTYKCRNRSGGDAFQYNPGDWVKIKDLYKLTVDADGSYKFIMVPIYDYEGNEKYYEDLLEEYNNTEMGTPYFNELAKGVFFEKTKYDVILDKKINYIILLNKKNKLQKKYFTMRHSIETTIKF